MIRHAKPPSPTWRAFLDNHLGDLAAIDFFAVPTATFRILFCFVVLRHDRRRVVHFNVTAHPTAQWTAQQIIEAFPYDEAPRYLIRDRDAIYGDYFRQRIKSMGVLLRWIAGKPPFLCNTHFPHDGVITLAHCAAPRRMNGRDFGPTKILTHFESDYGAATKVEYDAGQVTTNILPTVGCTGWQGFRGRIIDSPAYDA